MLYMIAAIGRHTTKIENKSSELKIGTAITLALGNADTEFGLITPFCTRVRSPYGKDGQIDGHIDQRSRLIMRLLRTVA